MLDRPSAPAARWGPWPLAALGVAAFVTGLLSAGNPQAAAWQATTSATSLVPTARTLHPSVPSAPVPRLELWGQPRGTTGAHSAGDAAGNVPGVFERSGAPLIAAVLAVPFVFLAALLWATRRSTTPAVAALLYTGVRTPAAGSRSKTALYGKNKNDNFIDQTFTVIADQLLKFLPTTKREKKAFMYYRDGMSAQGTGDYAEALQNYYEALKLEVDPFDRSYILYNIGLIHGNNGELEKALEYYYQALERNPNMPSALNNIAVIYHFQAETAEKDGRTEDAFELFDKAADYWREAIRLAPTNYMEAQNWLQSRGQLAADRPY